MKTAWLGAALVLAACGGATTPAPSGLPAGRLLAYEADGDGARFRQIADTSRPRNFEPFAVSRSLVWKTGGSASTVTDLSYNASRKEFLFSGMLPGDDGGLAECRPFRLTAAGDLQVVTWAEAPTSQRPCGYRWFGDDIVYEAGRKLWVRSEGDEPRLLAARAAGVTSRYSPHDGGAAVVEPVYKAETLVRGADGKVIAKIPRPRVETVCVDGTGSKMILRVHGDGAQVWTVGGHGEPKPGATLESVVLKDDKHERWGGCAFSPDGGWVAFLSNRDLGNRRNVMAGVSNPRYGLYGWEVATGRVVQMVQGELHLSAFIWAPAEAR